MSITNLPVIEVPIAEIVVGQRRREQLGRLKSLQHSIETHGLIHPILLRNGYELVAGGRRLEACRLLDWVTIPARHVDALSDEELRAIELDENTEREALSDYAASKARLAMIRQAEATAKAEAASDAVQPGASSGNGVTTTKQKKKKGGQKKPGSKRDVAERTGVSRETRARDERHVELAEQFPFMQRPGWVQHGVLEAGTVLDKLTPKDQQAAAALLDQPAIPPKTAIAILENLADMEPKQRKTVFEKAKSDDEIERRTALTMAAKLPPPPDPGLISLGKAVQNLSNAERATRIKKFKPEISSLLKDARELDARFTDYWKEVHIDATNI